MLNICISICNHCYRLFGESAERREGADNCKIDRKLDKPMTGDAYSSFDLQIRCKSVSLYMTYAAYIHEYSITVSGNAFWGSLGSVLYISNAQMHCGNPMNSFFRGILNLHACRNA